jgi:hypothetical protein
MRWDVSIGVQRNAVDVGTAATREQRPFPFVAKARANTAHLFAYPLFTGRTLLYRGHHGTGELWLVACEGIIARGDMGIDAPSREPSCGRSRMTHRLIFWTTSAISASLGGSAFTSLGLSPLSERSTYTPQGRSADNTPEGETGLLCNGMVHCLTKGRVDRNCERGATPWQKLFRPSY